MKRRQMRQMRVTDLDFDILRHIMFLVATSSDGAIDLSRITCVCKLFRKFAEETNVLRAANFNDVKLPIVGGSFWKGKSLLNSCACAGNLNVLFLIIKNLIERIKSAMNLVTVSQTTEMYIRTEAVGRYCTRARMRAVKPFLKVICEIIMSLNTDYKEIQEIVEMLQGIKSSLSVKLEAALPVWMLDCYKKMIEFIEELKDITVSLAEVIQRVKDTIVRGPIYDSFIQPLINS